MRCRIHLLFLSLLLIGPVLTGCAPQSIMPYTAEVDDPEYRRGKELQRLGRNPEALASFLKVIETRGGAAAESHLDAGILYQEHIRDPIAAIYHYRKFRELRPNAKQADLVLQRIDAATREFARTLPAQPLDNQVDRTDMMDAIDKLQRENLQLKEQLVAARAATLDSTRQPLAPLASDPAGASTGIFDFGANANGTDSPPSRTPDGPAPIGVVPVPSPSPAPLSFATGPAAPQPAIVATPPPTAPAAVTNAATRRHTVAKGDTLYSLAQRYYSNRSRWREIYAANRETMRSETDMRIGMELKIPQ